MRAPRDNNRVVTILGLLNSDGSTLKSIYADPTTHHLQTSDAATGSDNGGNVARDENRQTILAAVSSVDGTTVVPLYVDSTNNLLTKST